jgi:predicted membrane protein
MCPTHLHETRTTESAQLAYGIVVTIAGVILTLASFGLADPTLVFRVWPLIFIIAGAVKVVRSHDGRSTGGWILIVIGMWLLLRTTGQTELSFWDLLWPMVLIGVGVKLWMEATRQQRGVPRAARHQPLGTSASHLTAILAGSTRVVQEPAFPGASMTTVLGNCTLDLRHSGPPAGGEATIEVFALLGAHDIIVPEGWTVVSEATSVGASVDDQRSSFAGRTMVDGDARPRVVIRGMLILSGMTIKT